MWTLVQAQEESEGNIVGMIFSYFLSYFINFLDWLVKLINEYGLIMGSVLVAYLCTLISVVYLEVAQLPYETKGGYTPVLMAVAFLLGVQVCNVFLLPTKSGLAAYFVDMAFDPELLKKDRPDFYQKMAVLHPKCASARRHVYDMLREFELLKCGGEVIQRLEAQTRGRWSDCL
jgi:hypothetical protein